ncbi:hypothetical protein ABZX56_34125, partial [Streptomyces parvulus]
MIGPGGRAASFALAAGVARAALTALRTAPPGGRARWERVNHAGRTVDPGEEPLVVADHQEGTLIRVERALQLARAG